MNKIYGAPCFMRAQHNDFLYKSLRTNRSFPANCYSRSGSASAGKSSSEFVSVIEFVSTNLMTATGHLCQTENFFIFILMICTT